MLVVPDGADGGLEVLLAVLLLPPAIPDHLAPLSKSARWSFPESCQCVFLKCWHEHCAMQPHWSDRQTTFSPCATTQLLLLAFFRINVSSTSIIAGRVLFRSILQMVRKPSILPGYSFPFCGGIVFRRIYTSP